MTDYVIPQKPNLFQSKTQGQPIQTPQKPRTSARENKKEEIKEEEPVFDIPIIEQPRQVFEPVITHVISKNSGWKRWMTIASSVVVVIGLGVYFMFG